MKKNPCTTVKREENTIVIYKTESFSLQQCDYKVSDSNIPKRHINSICKEVTYQCPDCDYKSKRKSLTLGNLNFKVCSHLWAFYSECHRFHDKNVRRCSMMIGIIIV